MKRAVASYIPYMHAFSKTNLSTYLSIYLANGDFCEELPSENDFEAVLATFCLMAMVPTLLKQLLFACYKLQNSQNIPISH